MQNIQRNKSDKIIRKFDNIKEDFYITISNDSNIQFCGVVNQSQISFTFDICDGNSIVECYFIIPAKNNQNSELNILTNLNASNTKILIHIIALAENDAKITLNGNLHIKPGISKVEAKLYEETLLLGNAKYISLIPGLKVDSPDVIASHGAKIQRISPERLFYMKSRGLTEKKAIGMLINSYSEMISDKLQLNEKEKSDFYSMIQ